MGAGLAADEKEEMINFLTINLDVFAWSPSDMQALTPTSYATNCPSGKAQNLSSRKLEESMRSGARHSRKRWTAYLKPDS